MSAIPRSGWSARANAEYLLLSGNISGPTVTGAGAVFATPQGNHGHWNRQTADTPKSNARKAGTASHIQDSQPVPSLADRRRPPADGQICNGKFNAGRDKAAAARARRNNVKPLR